MSLNNSNASWPGQPGGAAESETSIQDHGPLVDMYAEMDWETRRVLEVLATIEGRSLEEMVVVARADYLAHLRAGGSPPTEADRRRLRRWLGWPEAGHA